MIWKIIGIVLLAEFPCLLRAFTLQVKTQDHWAVILGTVVGTIVALLLGVGLAESAGKYIQPKYLILAAGSAHVLIGCWVLLTK